MKKQYIVINENGSKFYYSNEEMSILHREDGPAIEYICGNKEWFKNGEFHREDGPAIDHTNYKEWWIEGKRYTEEEFNKKRYFNFDSKWNGDFSITIKI